MLTARARVNVRVLLHATPPRVRALLAHTPHMHARTPSQSATRAASRGHADGARGATSALALARGKARRGAARVWRPRERALAPARRAREQWRACRARALERAAKKSTGGVGGRVSSWQHRSYYRTSTCARAFARALCSLCRAVHIIKMPATCSLRGSIGRLYEHARTHAQLGMHMRTRAG